MKALVASFVLLVCSHAYSANRQVVIDPATSANHLKILIDAENSDSTTSYVNSPVGSQGKFLSFLNGRNYKVEKISYYPEFAIDESLKECVAFVDFFKPGHSQSSNTIFVRGIAKIPVLAIEYCNIAAK